MAGRFLAAAAERLAEFRSRPGASGRRHRPLDDADATWLVVFVDGFHFAGDTVRRNAVLGSAASNRS